MMNGNSFGLAGGSGGEEQIAKIARHLLYWLQCAVSGADPIAHRTTLCSRSEFAGLFLLVSVQKHVDAGVADDSQIALDGVFRIQGDVTGSASPNSQKGAVGVNGVFRKDPYPVSLSYSMGFQEGADSRTNVT